MKQLLRIWIMVAAASMLVSTLSCRAQEDTDAAAAAQDQAASEELENKLVKLHTLEEAFLKALRNRNLLQRFIVQEQQKLQNLEDLEGAEAEEIRKNIGTARKRLNTLNIAMDIVFGIGNRRDYEYNSVTSTVYLKVGTVEEAFARTVRARDLLKDFVAKTQTELETVTDDAKKAELESQVQNATRQYQLIQAALQEVFNVTQARNYLYDPKSATLYLRVTEEELEKLKTQLDELRQQQEAGNAAAPEAAE